MHRPLIGLYKLEDLSLQIGFPLDFRDWLEVDFLELSHLRSVTQGDVVSLLSGFKALAESTQSQQVRLGAIPLT